MSAFLGRDDFLLRLSCAPTRRVSKCYDVATSTLASADATNSGSLQFLAARSALSRFLIRAFSSAVPGTVIVDGLFTGGVDEGEAPQRSVPTPCC